MFNSLFVSTHRQRRRRAKAMDEIQLAVLQQIIRLNLFLRRAQAWLSPLNDYLWLPVIAFLFGVVAGLVITAVG
jgi:hypothetical protein